MKNYDGSSEIDHNPNQSYIPNNSYRILKIGGSGSEKINVLLNFIKHQRLDVDKTYLYIKDPFESDYQLSFNKREKLGIRYVKNPRAFSGSLQTIGDIYKNLEYYIIQQKNKKC